MEATFNKELGVAELEDSGMKVATLLPNAKRETASIMAYIGARFSRSNKSLKELVKESRSRGNEAQRLEKIFEGYGHRSVGDMARIMVSLEDIPDIEALYILYQLPHYAAQQRSTRYQDFSKSTVPKIECDSSYQSFFEYEYNSLLFEYQKAYEPTLKKLRNKYPEAEEKTLYARTLDEIRSLLPTGIPTNLVLYTDARTLSELIAKLRGSFIPHRNKIGNLLYHLLKGTYHAQPNWLQRQAHQLFGYQSFYIPEAWRLIRHAEPNDTQFLLTKAMKVKMLSLLNFSTIPNRSYIRNTQSFTINKRVKGIDLLTSQILERLLALECDNASLLENEKLTINQLKEIFSPLEDCNDKDKQLGNLGQVGAVNFSGLTDIGTLRDLNRHRSTERFFPFLEEASLPITRSHNLNSYDIENYYRKYLLTLETPVRYFIGVSLTDLIYLGSLRTRKGGHQNYRELVYNWVKQFSKGNHFESLLETVTEPNPEKDFYNR